MVSVEPTGERAVRAPQRSHDLGVLDRRVHLEPIADDARVGEQSRALADSESRHDVRVEPAKRLVKGVPLLEDRQPRQAGLVDFQHQPLQQLGVSA